MGEARFWATEGQRVHCQLCPRECRLPQGATGACRARVNVGGTLESRNYGRVTSIAFDPLEKKPLYHFHPGRGILSLGTFGCNLSCRFCQNYAISQMEAPSQELSPRQIVAIARDQGEQCAGVAFTYSEPSVWYEFVLDTAGLVQESGMATVLVSNGYLMPQPLEHLIPFIDAANIDIKAFNSAFYRDVCGGGLDPVLRTVERMNGRVHVELTTLLIPGLNDDPGEIERLVEWVASLDRRIPLHFSRYFPTYRMELPPTPVETLERAYDIARERLDYVYLGNLESTRGQDTFCPGCGARLIQRRRRQVRFESILNGQCTGCGRPADIIGDP